MIAAPWVHSDEQKLYGLMREAWSFGRALEVVTGSAPGWGDPWARRKTASVRGDASGWRYWPEDEFGQRVDEREVQLARLAFQQE